MTEKLRSHLKSEKGFTLIELLVVIAIIAILVTIVLVAINPLARIQDAQRRDAQAALRQVAGALEACYTDVLGNGTAATDAAANDACNTFGELTTGLYLKQTVQGVTIDSTDTTNVTLCASAIGGGQTFGYKNDPDATPADATADNPAGEVFVYSTTGAAVGDCTSEWGT